MKADPRPRSAHHLYQGLMIDVWNDGVLGSLPVKMGEQEKNARQSFLAEIAALNPPSPAGTACSLATHKRKTSLKD